MKKQKICSMLMLLTMFLVVACNSNDNDNGSSVREKLVGVWKTTLSSNSWKYIELRSDGSLYYDLRINNGEIRGSGESRGHWHYSEEGQTIFLYTESNNYTLTFKVTMADDGKAWAGYETTSNGGTNIFSFVRIDGTVNLDIDKYKESYFYLGTSQPTLSNYKTLPGVVWLYTSSIPVTTTIVHAGETLYMLCPANSITEKVRIKDEYGNLYYFLDLIDVETIPGHTIYKTQIWSKTTKISLDFYNTVTYGELDGVWQGTIMGNYYSDRYGTTRTDYDTEIRFYQNNSSSSGAGYEIDRDNLNGHISRFDFDWILRDGRIYITYDDGYRVVIRDWEIYNEDNTQRFRGYFDDYDTDETIASFNLVKVSERYSY